MNKIKAYIILDEEGVIMGIVKTETRAKAIYQCWKNWENDIGLNLIEFSKVMVCYRNKIFDNIKFDYFDGRDIESEKDIIIMKDLVEEVRKSGEN